MSDERTCETCKTRFCFICLLRAGLITRKRLNASYNLIYDYQPREAERTKEE
jgi:hypothetical protein